MEGRGGDDDDTVTQTPRRISPKQPIHMTLTAAISHGTYSTFVMPDHLTQSPNLILDFANSSEGFGGKLEIGRGGAFRGMMTTLFRGTPRTISPHPLRTHHTYTSTFLATPTFCTVFTALLYYPTTRGLAVSSPSSLQLQLLSQFWGLPLQLHPL